MFSLSFTPHFLRKFQKTGEGYYCRMVNTMNNSPPLTTMNVATLQFLVSSQRMFFVRIYFFEFASFFVYRPSESSLSSCSLPLNSLVDR
jgi:hypothetical protein